MNETDSVGGPNVDLKKRSFLKTVKDTALVTALGSVAVGVAAAELSPIDDPVIRTKYGSFVPLPEAHSIGINTKDIPPNSSLVFFESSGAENELILESHPFDKIRESRVGKYLPYLLENHIDIMVGDVKVPSDPDLNTLLKTSQILAATTAPFAGKAIDEVLLKKMLRRKLFEKAGKIIAAAGLGYTASTLLNTLLLMNSSQEQTTWKRLISRMQGIYSHMDPLDAVIFFRNAVMANNLLQEGLSQMKPDEKNPVIPFNIGGAHMGMEDLLILGPDVCRFIITSYPKEYLKEIGKSNSGIKSIATRTILTFPKGKTIEDPSSPANITVSRYTDQTLLAQLKQSTT